MLAADKWELRKDLTGVMFEASTAHEPPYVDVVFVTENNNNYFPPGYQAIITITQKYCHLLSPIDILVDSVSISIPSLHQRKFLWRYLAVFTANFKLFLHNGGSGYWVLVTDTTDTTDTDTDTD